MSKESIIAFSQAKAEPLWLQDLRQAAFDKPRCGLYRPYDCS